MEMSIYLTAPLALDKICRACLSEAGDMKPLFGTCLDEMFVNVASIQVYENDGLPNLMCVRCVLQCSRAYAFKQLCEKNDNILKQYVSPEFQDQLAKSLIQKEIKVELQEPMRFIAEATNELITDENPPKFVDVNYIDNGMYKIEVEDDAYVTAATLEACASEKKMLCGDAKKNSKLEHPCSKYEVSFALKVDLNEHMMSHSKDLETLPERIDVSYRDDGACKIEVEGNTSITVTNPDAECEPGEKTISCDYDQRTSKLKFPCSKCDMSFAFKVDLKVHMLTHPKELRRHVCHVCKNAFPELRILKRHLKIHLVKKPYQCNECDMSFVQKCYLKNHKKKHTGELRNVKGKPHLCSVCGAAFKWVSSLYKHMKYHTGHNLFSCKYCNKQYAEGRSLRAHIKSHTREKPQV